MSESFITGSAKQQEMDPHPARIVFFLGPRPASWNGVMRYSLDTIRMMSAYPQFQIDTVDIAAEPRSLKRYLTQFMVYPLRAIAAARASRLVVLYQEDLSFLIPVIRLAGGRVCMILHHVQHPGQARGPVEMLKNLYIRIMQPLIAKADLVVSPSDTTVDEARNDIGVPPERLQMVPNAFDGNLGAVDATVRAKARATLAAEFGVNVAEQLVLLNVGTDETRKNNATLFRALALMSRKDIVVLRVGRAQNQANRDECRALAKAANVTVHFLEDVRDEDMGLFYQAADLYVSPTLQEGFGRTVIEAQLVGIPVIASNLAVFRSTMGDTFEPVDDPMNAAEWATSIAKLASDPVLAGELVQRGRVNAARYSTSVVAASLCRIFARAVQR